MNGVIDLVNLFMLYCDVTDDIKQSVWDGLIDDMATNDKAEAQT
jgi:hypothetical protein